MRFAPTYGPMQSGATAGFTTEASWGYSLLGLLWSAALCAIAATAFRRRTKDHAHRDTGATVTTISPIVVTVAPRADGSFEVRSNSGPVVLCSQLPRCPAGCGEDEVVRPRQPAQHPAQHPAPRRRNRHATAPNAPPAHSDPPSHPPVPGLTEAR